MMTIKLNGKSHPTTATTVRELLVELQLAERPVVVEWNQAALLPREHSTQALTDGDVIELVQITAGG
jgi:sulfur carrier protein